MLKPTLNCLNARKSVRSDLIIGGFKFPKLFQLIIFFVQTVKQRYDLEAKAIIEGSCSPNKKRNVRIYENLIRADEVNDLLDSKLSLIRNDEEMSPSAPPLHQDENKSNSSMTTAEATEAYYSNRNLNSANRLNRFSSNAEEEFSFTDSMLDELAYNK